MAAARHLVVVGGADASTTDALADALRDEFAVRTAYSQADLLASLDEEVDVVLVDPRLSDFEASRLRERLDGRGLDCQVGVLTDERVETATDARTRAALADAFVTVSPGSDDDAWRTAVSRLATRARYRKRLEEYYDIADEYAALVVDTTGDEAAAANTEGDDDAPDRTDGATDEAEDSTVEAERERLADLLDRLRADLADAYDDLDDESLFDVAIDSWQGPPPPWHDLDAPDTDRSDDESP
jgi:hypothetical protein